MKATKLMPFLAIVALLGFSSCATETSIDDQIEAMNLPTAPEAKQIEIEIMELIVMLLYFNNYSWITNNIIIFNGTTIFFI